MNNIAILESVSVWVTAVMLAQFGMWTFAGIGLYQRKPLTALQVRSGLQSILVWRATKHYGAANVEVMLLM